MNAATVKRLMSVLLVATGVLHIVVAVAGAPDHLRIPLAAFGALYGTLGVLLLRGGRPIVLASMAACAVGLGVGGTTYLQSGGPNSLPVMFLIDAVVIVCGGLWLAKGDK
jgi:membrane associated rhomboid family serine protease